MKPDICNFFPIPDLLKTDQLLCIQPHPDDLEIGAGAAVARMIQSGTKVTCLTVTDGSAGTYDSSVSQDDLIQTRYHETLKASEILGIKELLWLGFADGGNLPYEEVRTGITRTIRKIKPNAVLVCDPWLPYEAHSDHIRTGLAASEAAFLSGMPYFCPSLLEEGFEPHTVSMIAFYYTAYPNTFIDVDKTWELKLAAIDCHTSQFPPDKVNMLKEYLTAKAREQAKKQDCEFVEALKVLSTNHLHIFEDAWQC